MKSAPEALLQIENLAIHYPGRSSESPAVRNVSYAVNQDQSAGLIGQSGSGKSSIARAVAGLLKPSGGQLLWKGTDIAPLPVRERLRRGIRIQMVFQDPSSSLDPMRTIAWSITEAAATYGAPAPDLRSLLERVGLDPAFSSRYPHQLSGGQKQRACIARALACEPELLICDEPVSSLDVSVQAQVLNLLKSLLEERHFTLLFIGHDLGVIRFLCNHVAVLANGALVESGPVEQVIERPTSEAARNLRSAAENQQFRRPFDRDISSPECISS